MQSSVQQLMFLIPMESAVSKPVSGDAADCSTRAGAFHSNSLISGLPAFAIAALFACSGSMKNLTYFALTSQSLTDFDWLAFLDLTAYSRGGPPLQ